MIITREFTGNLTFEKLIKFEIENLMEKAVEKESEVQYNNRQVGIVANENLSEAIV